MTVTGHTGAGLCKKKKKKKRKIETPQGVFPRL